MLGVYVGVARKTFSKRKVVGLGETRTTTIYMLYIDL